MFPQVLRRANQLDISVRLGRGGAARGRATAEASPFARGGVVSDFLALVGAMPGVPVLSRAF